MQALLKDTFPGMFRKESPLQMGSSEEGEREKTHVKGKWDSLESRRTFLVVFAQGMGFDPLVKANWKGKYPRIQQAPQVRRFLIFVLD